MEEKNNKKPFHKKDFHKKGDFKGKKFGGKGKPFGKKPAGKPDFKKKKLAPGVEFIDRELGVGIVRQMTEEGVIVAFGDVEKLIPKKKPFQKDGFKKEGFKKRDGFKKDFKKDFTPAKPMEKRVFTFDAAPAKEEKRLPSNKWETVVGLEVTDETLGKGTVSRITERGTYVTYEESGERVLYPMGLPNKLLRTAYPETKKPKKEAAPKGKARTYTVPEAEAAKKEAKPKVEVRPVKESHRGNTHYIELGVGTPVTSPEFGKGVITDIADGAMVVDFGNTEKTFRYPRAFMEGQIEVVEE